MIDKSVDMAYNLTPEVCVCMCVYVCVCVCVCMCVCVSWNPEDKWAKRFTHIFHLN